MRQRFSRRLVVIVGHGGRSVCGTRTWWVGLAVGLHVFASASPALAQAGERTAERELIEVDYSADPSCPTLEDLMAKVRTYTTRWALAPEDIEARRFRIELRTRDGRAVGTLEVAEPRRDGDVAGTSASRTITGPDCETVARGMAIAVAVAVDPSALLADRGAEPEPEPTPPPAPASNAPPPAPTRETDHPSPRPAMSPSQPPRFAIDVRAELTSAVVVGVLPVVAAAVEVEPFAGERSRRFPRWLRPTVALGIRQSSSRSIERSAVTTDFLWTAGVLRLCPARFVGADSRLEITPCFEGDLGVLHADAKGSTDARSTTNTWLDLGVSARATWSIGAWFVGGAASMIVPVSRNRFELSTGTLVSRAPPVGITLGLGGGLRF